jgi:hypothetical protein
MPPDVVVDEAEASTGVDGETLRAVVHRPKLSARNNGAPSGKAGSQGWAHRLLYPARDDLKHFLAQPRP